jgi:hypothetical protein
VGQAPGEIGYNIVLVGLPEMAVKESVHRIERALANLVTTGIRGERTSTWPRPI